jgi:hypothetical protein
LRLNGDIKRFYFSSLFNLFYHTLAFFSVDKAGFREKYKIFIFFMRSGKEVRLAV